MLKNCGFPLKLAILLFPAIIYIIIYVLKQKYSDIYFGLICEDCLVEYLTAAFYLISSIIASSILISFFKQKHTFLGFTYAFLACGMFFVFGEEISWGQRILNISPPQFFLEHSTQKEVNLHNIYPIQRILHKIYILVGLYGAFLWILFLKIRKNNLLINPYIIPKWYLSSYFLTVSAYYVYLDYIEPVYKFWKITAYEQEPAELILSMGFFLFVLVNKFRQIKEFKKTE